jgi:hypothetical protein
MDHACKIIPLQMRLPLLRSLRTMSHRNVVFQILAIPVFLWHLQRRESWAGLCVFMGMQVNTQILCQIFEFIWYSYRLLFTLYKTRSRY